MAALAERNAERAGVADKVKIIAGDIFENDFSEATVVTLYLLPDLNFKLRPQILKMKPGTRVVSHAFNMRDWEPDDTLYEATRDAYLWIVPAHGRRALADRGRRRRLEGHARSAAGVPARRRHDDGRQGSRCRCSAPRSPAPTSRSPSSIPTGRCAPFAASSTATSSTAGCASTATTRRSPAAGSRRRRRRLKTGLRRGALVDKKP